MLIEPILNKACQENHLSYDESTYMNTCRLSYPEYLI